MWTQGKPRVWGLYHLDKGIRAWLEGRWVPME